MRNTTFFYAKHCYKMKIFSMLGWGGGPFQKWPVNQLSSMHKQTTLKHIIQTLNIIQTNIYLVSKVNITPKYHYVIMGVFFII